MFASFLCCPSPAMRLVCISLARHLQVFDSSVPRGYVLFCRVFFSVCFTVIAFCESLCFLRIQTHKFEHIFISCTIVGVTYDNSLSSNYNMPNAKSFSLEGPPKHAETIIPSYSIYWWLNIKDSTFMLYMIYPKHISYALHSSLMNQQISTLTGLGSIMMNSKHAPYSCDFLKVNRWSLLWALDKWSLVGMKAFWPCVWEANGFLAMLGGGVGEKTVGDESFFLVKKPEKNEIVVSCNYLNKL